MRTKVLFICGWMLVSAVQAENDEPVLLPDIEVSVSRVALPPVRQQMQVRVSDSCLIAETQLAAPKDFSQLVPNLYMPDYGSSMTSSIYVRGLGNRINDPVLGMVVDGVPLLDKNMFDHSLQDVARIELLCGPQGSLYGRNSPAGVMEIRTLRPLDFDSLHVRGELSYATAGSLRAQASVYHPVSARFGYGVAAHYRQTDGFYTNEYTGQKIDYGRQAGGRLMLEGRPTSHWQLSGFVQVDALRQGAFPYMAVATGKIAYNAPGGYERLSVLPALRICFDDSVWRLAVTSSFQLLYDDMRMDNDYTPAAIFTLRQWQRQHNGTLDVLLDGKRPCKWYAWQLGWSAFTKNNKMEAPVTFQREGIEQLMLANANRGIRTVFPDDSIDIGNNEMPIPSSFGFYNAGTALSHHSHFTFGKWHIAAGLRIDYEYVRMDYRSTADLDYRFTLLMSGYKALHTEIAGRRQEHYVQVLPRLAVSYEASKATVYAYAAKGYRAGGYNPQIFSTITQNQVMTDMASAMGMHLQMADPRFCDVAISAYQPEKDWTFELGAHVFPVKGLKLDADVFHIRCYDQQVTVFPNGKTTGRMMANAARTNVWGTELAVRYRWSEGKWNGLLDASYGWTDARFVDFNDGMGDYAGKVVPYAPQHTAHALVQAEFRPNRKALRAVSLSGRLNVAGPIYWNERNDCRQEPYATLGATLSLQWKYLQLQLWGKNLTDTAYSLFYFRSMERDFLQQAKGRQLGFTLKFHI